jgi:hypothetical protein
MACGLPGLGRTGVVGRMRSAIAMVMRMLGGAIARHARMPTAQVHADRGHALKRNGNRKDTGQQEAKDGAGHRSECTAVASWQPRTTPMAGIHLAGRPTQEAMHMARKPSDDKRPDDGRPQNTPMSPGDDAPAGTPGTGEAVCPRCGGTGQLKGQPCPECDGTGKVIKGIGGA